jgi:hypothetical protein
MPFADHQLSLRQRRCLRTAAAATGLFAAASIAGAGPELIVGLALLALGTTWRVWQARHDDPREGWRG